MQASIIAANLYRLRSQKGWTQEQLAQKAKMSRIGYRNLESGKSVPRSDTLLAVAVALEVPPGQLFEEQPTLRHVRFRASKNLASRSAILGDVARWLADVAELEQLLEKKRLSSVLERIEGRKPADAAPAARKALHLDEDAPIRDICGLIEERGKILVHPFVAETDAFFGLAVSAQEGGPAIAVNVWNRISVERWIFSVAHELGHLVLHCDGAFDSAQTEEVETEEKEANVFASLFLMPDAVFWREWEESSGLHLYDRVCKVKRIFHVSYKTVLARLAGRYPNPKLWGTFVATHKRRHRSALDVRSEPQPLGAGDFRALEPASGLEPSKLDRCDFFEDGLLRLVREAIERELITFSRAAEILGKSLEEVRELEESWMLETV